MLFQLSHEAVHVGSWSICGFFSARLRNELTNHFLYTYSLIHSLHTPSGFKAKDFHFAPSTLQRFAFYIFFLPLAHLSRSTHTWPQPLKQHFWFSEQPESFSHICTQIPPPCGMGQVPGSLETATVREYNPKQKEHLGKGAWIIGWVLSPKTGTGSEGVIFSFILLNFGLRGVTKSRNMGGRGWGVTEDVGLDCTVDVLPKTGWERRLNYWMNYSSSSINRTVLLLALPCRVQLSSVVNLIWARRSDLIITHRFNLPPVKRSLHGRWRIVQSGEWGRGLLL